MDLPTFLASTAAPDPPKQLSSPLKALWWDAKGDWEKAHQYAQADPSPDGSAVHAYLHRKEPDLANAQYWYGRAGRPPASGPLEDEWAALAQHMLERDDRRRHGQRPESQDKADT